jgi:DNA-binding response OmpR family regulator/signal transduction histidine kinase
VTQVPSRPPASVKTATQARQPGQSKSRPPQLDDVAAGLFDALPLGLIGLDSGGSIAMVNAPAAAMLGVRPEALVGQAVREAASILCELAGDDALVRAQLDRLDGQLRGETSGPTELSVPVATEHGRTIHLSLVDAGGRRFAVLTQRAEQPPDQSQDREKGMAEIFSTAATALLARLGAIEDVTATLRTAPRLLDPTVYTHAVEDIGNAAEEMRAALAALDDIVLLRRGPQSLQVAPLDLTDLVMTLLADWKTQAPDHSLELSMPGEVPGIIADAARLERTLDLLIAHAIRFVPKGESIRVTIRPGAEEILVSVRNHGHVIDAEQLKHLFKPLLASSGAGEAAVEGDLGLALARAVAHAHGGRIWAELREPETHLAIFLALPLVPPEARAPLRSSARSALPDVAVPAARLALKRGSPVILVVDGDARMARFLRANLEAQPYRVVVAHDLEEAYRLIDLEEPDLLLLDSTLPSLEQPETLQRLGEYASAPLILLAPRSDPLDCARALDLGVADYVAKPFSVEELLARVRAALRKREGEGRANARESVFTSGDLRIDFSLHQVTVGGRPTQLSKTEFKLLRALAQHAGMVLSHEVLLERVWGPGYGHEVDFVWVYIRRLRRKIEPDPSRPRFILTVPGVGYRLARA